MFAEVLPKVRLRLLYDVSHNTLQDRAAHHRGQEPRAFRSSQRATRSLGPGYQELPASLQSIGQPVLIGGTMETESNVLVGTKQSEELSFSSAWHGAGRSMSRTQATERWQGRKLIDELAEKGVLIRT